MRRLRRLDTRTPDFEQALASLLDREVAAAADVEARVSGIIAAVKARGDSALLEYTNRFDVRDVTSGAALEITDLAPYLDRIDAGVRDALQAAARRIRRYHEQQRQESWRYQDETDTVLGQQITALARVGVYVPGGKAAYPSSVLMNVLPAKVAGVDDIIMVVPAPRGQVEDSVLAAASIAGVDRVFTIGGAQAIAALAFGTETIPAVDKIVGPGNIYVATAKAQVFGKVGIDMIAGPSEILIVCDGHTDPDWIAMDLFSQAEHDEHAQAILISPQTEFLDAVDSSIARLLPRMARAEIIAASLSNQGARIAVANLDEAIELVNRIAPEHLELSLADAAKWVDKVRHAGAIFLGRHTAEALGDYCAGPNHVLPTAGTARFSSPLGVYDFQKRSSLIEVSPRGAAELAQIATVLARAEGLTAHAQAAAYRRGERDAKLDDRIPRS